MRAQRGRLEDVHPGVDLGDLRLGIRRVLLLDDALHAAHGIAHDPAIAGRVRDDGAQNGRRRTACAVRTDEAGQRLVVQERHVAAQDEHIAREVGYPLEGDLDGSAGARDLVLVDHEDLGRDVEDGVGDEVAFVADDHEDVRRLQVPRGVQHVPEERSTPDAVQHLRQGGLHPGALSCGEDDDGEFRRVRAVRVRHAPPPGFEPGLNSSKGCRAAVTPRRTTAPASARTARQVCQTVAPAPPSRGSCESTGRFRLRRAVAESQRAISPRRFTARRRAGPGRRTAGSATPG